MSPEPRRGRPPVTSREEILAAARHVIERDGWQMLTVRRLSKNLGIGTTTIYHHFRDRDDLLVQLVNDAAQRHTKPDLPAEPKERLIVITLAMHEALGTIPWAVDVLAVDGEACIGKPGEDALWFVDRFLESAYEAGCTPAQAEELFTELWYFTVGVLLVRLGGLRRRGKLAGVEPDRPTTTAHERIFARGVRALVMAHFDELQVRS